ncbi:DNA-binding response OmpR family regulator [Pseudonocardia eucalypti]|uniref:winged helix-turn-helix domain-containing protein n=1 Tax=Pseudonocardia eucalypti TaxID=648755 RepID=UPI001613DA0E|nr:DNA-binding response OmpR family regulator [Pseudonocardia eucalypti]
MINVFLVEDDRRNSERIAQALSKCGMRTLRSRSTGLVFDAVRKCDVAIVSFVSPTEDHVAMVSAIRAVSGIPVLALIDNDRVRPQVDGHILASRGTEELAARIVEVVRRPSADAAPNGVVRAGDVVIDLKKRLVTVDGAEVRLTDTEFSVLAVIAGERGRLCDKDRLIAQALGRSTGEATAVLHVYISKIRKKIGRPSLIEQASGYRISGMT